MYKKFYTTQLQYGISSKALVSNIKGQFNFSFCTVLVSATIYIPKDVQCTNAQLSPFTGSLFCIVIRISSRAEKRNNDGSGKEVLEQKCHLRCQVGPVLWQHYTVVPFLSEVERSKLLSGKPY